MDLLARALAQRVIAKEARQALNEGKGESITAQDWIKGLLSRGLLDDPTGRLVAPDKPASYGRQSQPEPQP